MKRVLLISTLDWPGTRRQQVARAREWFIEWRATLPARRTWLEGQLVAHGGPPVPDGVEGLDDIVAWIEQLRESVDVTAPGVDPEPVPPAPEWDSGDPWWDAAVAGLTALVIEVMQRERPLLELELREERGALGDLRPGWLGRPGMAGPARLASGSLGGYRTQGSSWLESAIRVNLDQVPPGVRVMADLSVDPHAPKVYLEADPHGDSSREVLVNVDEWAQETLGDASFARLQDVFASVKGIESIEQTDRDEFEAVLTAAGALEPEAVRHRLQAALDALS